MSASLILLLGAVVLCRPQSAQGVFGKAPCQLDLAGHLFDFDGISEAGWVELEFPQHSARMYLLLCDNSRNVGLPKCSNGSTICLHFDNGSKRTEEHEAGSKIIETSFDDNSLVMTLEGKSICTMESDSHGDIYSTLPIPTVYKTVIRFECSETEEYPEALFARDCEFIIKWRTTSACPVQEKSVIDSCLLEHNTHSFDLRPLKKSRPYRVEGKGGKEFYVNFCGGPMVGIDSCPTISGLCQVPTKNEVGSKFLAKGSVLKYSLQKGLVLEYKKQKGLGKAIISFQCSKLAAEPDIVHVFEDNGSVWFSVSTSVVCLPVASKCHILNDDDDDVSYDLSILRKHTNNWQIKTIVGLYYINICDSLKPVQGVTCTGGAIGACLVRSVDNKTLSLGMQFTTHLIKGPNHIEINYVGGSQCESGHDLHHRLSIVMVCSEYDLASPKFVKEENCTHHFVWFTKAACPLKYSHGKNCHLRVRFNSEMTEHNYDFSILRNPKEDYRIEDAEFGTLRINICGHLIKPCNKETGVSACLTNKAGYELAIGRSVNDQPVFSNGRLTFTFEGASCNLSLSSKSMVILIMMCNYSDINTGPQLLTRQGCHFYLQWWTVVACVERSVSSCQVSTPNGRSKLDLSPLTSQTDNYSVRIPGGATIFLNVCHSIVPSSIAALCTPHSAACLVNSTDHRSVNIGTIQESDSPIIENGVVKIYYRNGAICHHGSTSTSSTEIQFICAAGAHYTLPKFVSSDNCRYLFEWRTDTVCNLDTEIITHSSDNGTKYNGTSPKDNAHNEPCTVRSPHTNELIDLRNLMKRFYTVGNIKLSVCTPLMSECPINPQSGSCMMLDEVRLKNVGNANGELKYDDGYVYLNYTGGNDGCSTVIYFTCDGRDVGPVIDDNINNCTIVISWNTMLACKDRLIDYCCRGADSPLCHLSGKYYKIPINGTELLLLSVCRPLDMLDLEPRCTDGSAACLLSVKENDTFTKAVSLGFPTTSSIVTSSNNVILRYYNGGKCSTDRNYSTLITFTCYPSVGSGQPEFLRLENCEYSVEWRTNVVCRREVPNCSETNSNTVRILTHLTKDPFVKAVAERSGNEYMLSLCKSDRASEADCGSDVCLKKGGHDGEEGSWYSRELVFSTLQVLHNLTTVHYERIRHHVDYIEDEDCGADLHFKCNPSMDVGQPVVISEKVCNLTVVLETRSACRNGSTDDAPTTPSSSSSSAEGRQPESGGWTGLIVGILISIVVVAIILAVALIKRPHCLFNLRRKWFNNQFRYSVGPRRIRMASMSEDSSSNELLFPLSQS